MSPGGTAQVCGIIHIETAPDHMLCSGLRTFRIHGPVLQHGIGILGIPVGAVFHDISQHVLQSERIGPDFRWLLRTVPAVCRIYDITVYDCRIRSEDSAPQSSVRILSRASFEEIRRGRASSCRIFPLGLRRQPVMSACLPGKPLAECLR